LEYRKKRNKVKMFSPFAQNPYLCGKTKDMLEGSVNGKILKVPGFWEGFASVFGFSQRIEKTVTDYEALCGDWENVGKDLRTAMNKYATI
jgi:hypothetical protein